MTQQQATDGMGKMELAIKRTADILFAMVGMVVLSPVPKLPVTASATSPAKCSLTSLTTPSRARLS